MGEFSAPWRRKLATFLAFTTPWIALRDPVANQRGLNDLDRGSAVVARKSSSCLGAELVECGLDGG